MNIAETLRGLLRRWYVVIPGLLLAAVAAGYCWLNVPPTYQRSASQLLLPAEATLPEVEIKDDEGEIETLAPNPFLYLGGLNTAADVLVSAVRGAPAVAEAALQHEGAEIEVGRDPMSSGPMLLITVTAPSDAAAAELIDTMLIQTEAVLEQLQTAQRVPETSRVLIAPIAVDTESVLGTKERMLTAAGAGAGLALLTLVLGAAVDGLVRRRRRGGRGGKSKNATGASADHRGETALGAPELSVDESEDDAMEAAMDRILARRGLHAVPDPDPVGPDADELDEPAAQDPELDAPPVGARTAGSR
jgi:hypothetical protein